MFTPNTVQHFLPEFYASSSLEALDSAIKLVWKVKEYLEREYEDLVLGKPEEVALLNRQHLTIQHDPLALEYFKHNQKHDKKLRYESDRLHIDASKGVPELETVNKVYASEDLFKITEFYEDPQKLDKFLNLLEGS